MLLIISNLLVMFQKKMFISMVMLNRVVRRILKNYSLISKPNRKPVSQKLSFNLLNYITFLGKLSPITHGEIRGNTSFQ